MQWLSLSPLSLPLSLSLYIYRVDIRNRIVTLSFIFYMILSQTLVYQVHKEVTCYFTQVLP